ncbi:MAG: sigma factor [Planctomycetota bacterium]|nr:sigma factor [Planctomycetota bacterium]
MAEEKRASREGVLAWAAGSRYRRLVGFVRRMVGDQGEAEDVVQEALFRALGSWGGV